METLQRLCLACKKPVKGRADKKFCNDYCRNIHNNKQLSESSSYMRALNRFLSKNRSILAELLGEEKMIKHPQSRFADKGFRFKYHTHAFKNQKGDIYYFCYEYGYLPLDNDWYLIVKKKEPI